MRCAPRFEPPPAPKGLRFRAMVSSSRTRGVSMARKPKTYTPQSSSCSSSWKCCVASARRRSRSSVSTEVHHTTISKWKRQLLEIGAEVFGGNEEVERYEKKIAELEWIISVIEEHPAYGYRRIGRELEERDGERVNHKRLRRVLKSFELGLKRCLPRSKPSTVAKLVAAAGGF